MRRSRLSSRSRSTTGNPVKAIPSTLSSAPAVCYGRRMLAYVPAQAPLNRGILVALVFVWTSILLTLGWAARMVVASPNMSQSRATLQTSLALIAKWVEQTGTATVMRAPIAEALTVTPAVLESLPSLAVKRRV